MVIGLVVSFILASSTPASSGTSRREAIPVALDFPAPDLELVDLDGRTVSLVDYRGQYVLINNWAIWCPPCRSEMPVLEAFYQDHRDQGFTLIAIEAGDPPDLVQEFVDRYRLSFLVWLDPENKALRGFANNALPSSYLIDPEGRVVLGWSGAMTRQTLDRYIAPLIANQ